VVTIREQSLNTQDHNSMIDKLIEFLGGVSKSNYNLLNIEYLQQRDLVNNYRAREESLIRQYQEEKAERLRLQEIIFTKFGIVTSASQTELNETELQPIGSGPQRITNLMRRMEQDDRKRVKSAKEA
jgi:hypothetical protein